MRGQEEHLARAVAEARDVIQEEVVELVGADAFLSLLGELAFVVERQELGRDRCVGDVVEQVLGDVCVALVCAPVDDVADEGLGHADVHVIHRNVVAGVGAPTERGLGEIACAEDEAADLVRHVHQDLRALAGLGVFVNDVVLGLVVADVGKVLAAGGVDGNGAQLGAEDFDQLGGVVLGARGGAKARHGDRDNAAAVEAELVKGVDGHEERERRVEPAGDADHELFRAGVAEALGEAGGLDGEDFLAAVGAAREVAGHEGVAFHAALEGQGAVAVKRRGADHAVFTADEALGEAAVAQAVLVEVVEVDVGDQTLRCKVKALGFAEQVAAFGNEAMAAVNDVGARLAGAGARIKVGAVGARGLLRHEAAAVVGLAE